MFADDTKECEIISAELENRFVNFTIESEFCSIFERERNMRFQNSMLDLTNEI